MEIKKTIMNEKFVFFLVFHFNKSFLRKLGGY